MAVKWESVRKGKGRARVLDLAKIARKELKNTLFNVVEPRIIKDHEAIVSDWKTTVSFSATRKEGPDLESFTSTDSEKYGYVDQGTPEHPISGNLSFKTGYSAKTAPNPGRSTGGSGTSSGPRVYAKAVTHPGVEARKFSVEIAKEVQPFFIRETEGAMVRIGKVVNNE